MTPLEMNAAIAQHLGWKNVHVYEDDAGPPIHCGTPPGPIPYDAVIPRYSEDLNAMHEAEKSLTNEQLEVYCNILHKPYHGVYWAIHATASQRAEAFLRAIWKWRDA